MKSPANKNAGHSPLFMAGDQVRIKDAYPIGHCRTPFYCRGHSGVIERYCGSFANPEELAYGRDGLPKTPLYRVRVSLEDLWKQQENATSDMIEIEIFEHWLEAIQVKG